MLRVNHFVFFLGYDTVYLTHMYLCFRGAYCIHLQGRNTQCHIQEVNRNDGTHLPVCIISENTKMLIPSRQLQVSCHVALHATDQIKFSKVEDIYIYVCVCVCVFKICCHQKLHDHMKVTSIFLPPQMFTWSSHLHICIIDVKKLEGAEVV
jgi:hypothetical protein